MRATFSCNLSRNKCSLQVETVVVPAAPLSRIKAVLHGTACNNDFLRNNVARKIEHRVTWYWGTIFSATFDSAARYEFLNLSQKLATQDDEYLESWLL